MIPLVLFSREADDDTLASVAVAMVQVKEQFGEVAVEPGKPDFPHLSKKSKLAGFVGQGSWIFFDRIKESTSWLLKSPSEWDQDSSFLALRKIVDAMHGVNDSAERGCRTAELYKVITTAFF